MERNYLTLKDLENKDLLSSVLISVGETSIIRSKEVLGEEKFKEYVTIRFSEIFPEKEITDINEKVKYIAPFVFPRFTIILHDENPIAILTPDFDENNLETILNENYIEKIKKLKDMTICNKKIGDLDVIIIENDKEGNTVMRTISYETLEKE